MFPANRDCPRRPRTLPQPKPRPRRKKPGRESRLNKDVSLETREDPVTHSVYFLAAACLAGAGDPAPMPVGSALVAPAPVYSAPAYTYPAPAYQAPEGRPGFMSRFKSKMGGMFHKKQAPATCPCQQQNQTVPNAEPPLADQGPLQQTSFPQITYPQTSSSSSYSQVPLLSRTRVVGSEEVSEEGDKPAQVLNSKYVEKVGHEEDYSWVTGQLYYVHASSSGYWVVRYATVDTEDKFGGAVVLAPAVNMKNYREGDLVSVKGEVINNGRANKHLGGPLYRATSIDMIDRADQ